MVYYSLRREQLCQISGCDEALEVRDDEGFLLRRERCDHCELDKLDWAVGQNPVLHRCFELDFALTSGIKLTLDDVDVEEWRALKILRCERSKFEAEQIKNERNQHQVERMRNPRNKR